jgi:PIN domain nuclease of toxin-antitoxin system
VIRLDAAVTDTHALLYHAAGRGLAPRAAAIFKAAEAGTAQIYVPMAVIWEVTLLARAGKINLRRTTRAFLTDLFTNPAYQPFDLTPEQICDADELRFNRDPFDALIVAAANELELPLITSDVEIDASGAVTTIW